MKPSITGPKIIFSNPSAVTFTSAEIALIDDPLSANTIKPYAQSATVQSHYDSMHVVPDLACAQVANSRVAWGVFLTPGNDFKNLLFQVSGRARFYITGTSVLASGFFFFGRRASSDTVVSSKASANNTLDKWIVLPSRSNSNQLSNPCYIHDSICDEIWAERDASGYVWCFGYALDNLSGANAIGVNGFVDFSLRKWDSPVSEFRPEV